MITSWHLGHHSDVSHICIIDIRSHFMVRHIYSTDPNFFCTGEKSENSLRPIWGCSAVICFNLLSPSDAVWQQRSGSTLAQVMACCLLAPGHYQNLCWLIISKVLWHSSEGNSQEITQPPFTKHSLKMTFLKLNWNPPGANELTHWGRDKMDAISQTTYSSAFYWTKMYELRLKIHWSLFLRVQLTIFHHCFR